MADTKAPYGDVPYGDPGYLDADGEQASKSGKPGIKRYPLDAEHVKAAWSYINQERNASQYTAEQLSAIKGRIRSAMSKHGHDVSSDSGSDSSDSGSGSRSWTPDVELRRTPGVVEIRAAAEGGSHHIGGYGAVFGKLSRNLGGFVELVGTTAFNQTRQLGWPNVVCRLNHDRNQLLGTSAGRTLQLRTDNVGLDYEVEPPPSRRDIVELVARGDITQSSFAFSCPPGGDEWRTTDQHYPLRVLHEVQLLDVSPVTEDAAYTDATAGLRSLAAAMETSLEEVRSMAAADELRKFFTRTDNRGPAVPKVQPVTGAVAMMRLMEKRRDPWADQG